jgi:hypothetical protein
MTLSSKNSIHMFLIVLLLVSLIGLPGPITWREVTAQTRQGPVVREVDRRALSPASATTSPLALARLEEHKAILVEAAPRALKLEGLTATGLSTRRWTSC